MQAQIALGNESRKKLARARKKNSRKMYQRWRNRSRESKIYLCTLFTLADGKCPECKVDMIVTFADLNMPNKATLDHIDPLSETMEHDKLNLRIMCQQCNGTRREREAKL